MQIPAIVLIVFACGLTVSGLTCYECGNPGNGTLKQCTGSTSPTLVCPDKVGNDTNDEYICSLARTGDKEVRTCISKNFCEKTKKEASSSETVVCCRFDLCNKDAPEAASARAASASTAPASSASASAATTSRISVNCKLLAVLLLLPIIFAMYNTFE